MPKHSFLTLLRGKLFTGRCYTVANCFTISILALFRQVYTLMIITGNFFESVRVKCEDDHQETCKNLTCTTITSGGQPLSSQDEGFQQCDNSLVNDDDWDSLGDLNDGDDVEYFRYPPNTDLQTDVDNELDMIGTANSL